MEEKELREQACKQCQCFTCVAPVCKGSQGNDCFHCIEEIHTIEEAMDMSKNKCRHYSQQRKEEPA